jgi:hypothetical protein
MPIQFNNFWCTGRSWFFLVENGFGPPGLKATEEGGGGVKISAL